jgi:PilZ domain
MSREKRSSPRVQPFVARCRLRVPGRVLVGYITDLSLRGARVAIEEQAPAAGTRLDLEVRFRDQLRHARLAAEVKWAHVAGSGGGHRVGLRFVEMGVAERTLLDRVIEEFHTQAARIG